VVANPQPPADAARAAPPHHRCGDFASYLPCADPRQAPVWLMRSFIAAGLRHADRPDADAAGNHLAGAADVGHAAQPQRAGGRAHLIALWTWAGINKLLSPAFLRGMGPSMMFSLLPFAPTWLHENGGYVIALTELFTGLFALFPRTRLMAGLLAFGLHTGIFL